MAQMYKYPFKMGSWAKKNSVEGLKVDPGPKTWIRRRFKSGSWTQKPGSEEGLKMDPKNLDQKKV